MGLEEEDHLKNYTTGATSNLSLVRKMNKINEGNQKVMKTLKKITIDKRPVRYFSSNLSLTHTV